jgi:hypothetical protein
VNITSFNSNHTFKEWIAARRVAGVTDIGDIYTGAINKTDRPWYINDAITRAEHKWYVIAERASFFGVGAALWVFDVQYFYLFGITQADRDFTKMHLYGEIWAQIALIEELNSLLETANKQPLNCEPE